MSSLYSAGVAEVEGPAAKTRYDRHSGMDEPPLASRPTSSQRRQSFDGMRQLEIVKSFHFEHSLPAITQRHARILIGQPKQVHHHQGKAVAIASRTVCEPALV